MKVKIEIQTGGIKYQRTLERIEFVFKNQALCKEAYDKDSIKSKKNLIEKARKEIGYSTKTINADIYTCINKTRNWMKSINLI